MADNTTSSGRLWLVFTFLTVFSWGVYGVMLHTGSMSMADRENGRLKAFLIVGIAYFITAVLLPMVILASKGASIAFWTYPAKGFWWSLIAGTVGAVGALGVLLAFGAAPDPRSYVPVIMSIVFAGAPIVNAVVALMQHPPNDGWGSIKPQFYVGILCSAVGGCLVTYFKPDNSPPPAKAPAITAPANPGASAPGTK